jgi:uncharacterized membrane protein
MLLKYNNFLEFNQHTRRVFCSWVVSSVIFLISFLPANISLLCERWLAESGHWPTYLVLLWVYLWLAQNKLKREGRARPKSNMRGAAPGEK